MSVKKRTTLANVIALPLVFAVGLSGAGFYSTMILKLLPDEDYFDISGDRIGRVSSNILFYATLVSIFASLAAGYCYDIVGR